MRMATEGADLSFSGSDGSEPAEDYRLYGGGLAESRASRNLSTPKGKLYYKTDTHTPTESPFRESPVATTATFYKGNVKNLPNYLRPTRASTNQSAHLPPKLHKPVRPAGGVRGSKALRNSTTALTVTKKESMEPAPMLSKSPRLSKGLR